ncbi:unnamed protein product [Adineta steineri]|uniref:Uncharacterized protein n=1 Tax=Adineta steineri TaxID=433720 RepID=A0A815CKH4_9BILA|nr:unnamed protein product [Adineta steineri]CAF1284900.1 unnamed protein product [Adineta steineri]
MTEQFRDCFVGEKGYDALKKLMRGGNELCTDIAKCWQERYDVEIAYAKGLRKNSEAFQKLAGRSKGSLVEALTTVSTQTNNESEAHNLLANVLLNKISLPMKNLTDTQSKARKPIEDALYAKFKIWKDKKEIDNKYRQRQFDNSKEIEGLYLKMDEIPKAGKNSTKETNKIETALRKLEQELEKTENKYHAATKEVEISRQSCDAEMCKSCDQMQTMELDRINEMDKFIQTYTSGIKALTETMNQVTQDLYSIRVTPQDDIVVEAKLNLQVVETEILLYDIYAQNDHNAMSQERRVLSLMHWMQMLKQDIEIQRRSKDDVVGNADNYHHHRNGSSSSSNDDDGAMHHHKKGEKKKREGIENLHGFCKQNQKFSTSVNSSEIIVNRECVRLLQCLYEGSLYQMEKVFNQIKHLPEPQYEHAQRFAKSYTDKNIPTTLLRIPFQPLSHNTPSTTSYLARSTPILGTPVLTHHSAPAPPPPPPYPVHAQAPIGWAVNDMSNDHSGPPPDNRSAAPGPPYPVLPSVMTTSTDSLRQQQPNKHVKVLHSYVAEHADELTIQPGDIIILLERRPDQWCKGNLHGRVGLFPGNFVQDI